MVLDLANRDRADQLAASLAAQAPSLAVNPLGHYLLLLRLHLLRLCVVLTAAGGRVEQRRLGPGGTVHVRLCAA